MPKPLKLTVGSHFFKVTNMTNLGSTATMAFARTFIQYKPVRMPGGRYQREADKTFAAASKKRDEIRFHINSLSDFISSLSNYGISPSEIDREDMPIPIGKDIEVTVKDTWKLRDLQVPICEYLSAPPVPPHRSKFLGLATGQGKTLCALYSLANVKKRFVAVIKPMYLSKWVSDILKVYNCEKEDIIVIQGAAHLLALLTLAEKGELKEKFILVSNKTMQNWYKLYEEFGQETKDLGYPCMPDEFYSFIGAGVRLIDEVHQDFHLNFKQDLYTNVEKTISLSATLINKDSFLERMYDTAYPPHTRYAVPAPPKYNNVAAVMYHVDPRKVGHIRCSEWGSNTYSHIAYEKWIMKNTDTCNNYLRLINDVLNSAHYKDRQPGQKTLILCGSIAFCTFLTEQLRKAHPESDIRRFVEEDPIENLLESEICISTQLSAGTAHDIPMLRSVIMTNSIDSYQANIQALGRLRQMPFPTTFYYFVCTSIDKHIKYHTSKKQLFKDRVATQIEIGYPHAI